MACKITLKPKVIQLHWFFCFCVFFGQGLRKERAYPQGRQENQSQVYLPKGKGLRALQDSKGGEHPSCGEENMELFYTGITKLQASARVLKATKWAFMHARLRG